jgi:Cu-Zn family superoxide dismutase
MTFWKKTFPLLVLGGALITVAGCGGGGDDSDGLFATASLVDTQGRAVGTAHFTEASGANGVVNIQVRVNGLPAGAHGIHVHAVGIANPSDSPAFASAGGHFNPENRQHGLNNPEGAHAGDLPNLVVNANGRGTLNATTDRLTLSAGPRSVFDADGSALIIHANADDQTTNPTGNSGGRIAGGVIVR